MYISTILLLCNFVNFVQAKLSLSYSPEFSLYSADFVKCSVGTMDFVRRNRTSWFYVSNGTDLMVSSILKSLFNSERPMDLRLISTFTTSQAKMPDGDTCIVIANNFDELRVIIASLYYVVHFEECVVCLTFIVEEPVTEISRLTKNLWMKGIPRNLVFIIPSAGYSLVRIFGMPEYSLETCISGKLIEVGHCNRGRLVTNRTSLYPMVENLGGCEVSVMINPPYLPYVMSRTDTPGGALGLLMGELSEAMNFTSKFVWSKYPEDMEEHVKSADLSLAIDALPHNNMIFTTSSFVIGMVNIYIIVPSGHLVPLWVRALQPFTPGVWHLIFGTLVLLRVFLKLTKSDKASSNLALKLFAALVGTSMGKIPRPRYFRLLLWFWLLPSYILTQCYLGSLFSNLAFPARFHIDTIESLVNSRLEIYATERTWRSLCYLEELQKVCRKVRLVSDDYYVQQYFPYVMETGQLNNTATQANEEILNSYFTFRKVHKVKEAKFERQQTILAQAGSKYMARVYRIYRHVFEGGLYVYWKKKFTNIENHYTGNGTEPTDDEQEAEKVQQSFITSSIAVLMIGWIAGTLVFAREYSKAFKITFTRVSVNGNGAGIEEIASPGDERNTRKRENSVK